MRPEPWDYFRWQAEGYPESWLIILRTAKDVTEPILVIGLECAKANYGLGNRWIVDWERTYDMMESQNGLFVETMGSPADNKIRRYVQQIGVDT